MNPIEDSRKENWERELLESLAVSSLNEQRRSRRWGIFFKLLTFLYLSVLLFAAMDWTGDVTVRTTSKHAALIDLRGVIAADSAVSADKIITSLHSAFKNKNTKGVILRINSPGGSPVQAGIINDEIYRLRAKYPEIPLYAVVGDICASGGYYVAVAADKIFVDKASLIGSIGVLMDGFGFTGTLEKLGIERRLITAGENKGFLDPFTPLDPNQKIHAAKLLSEVHEQFIKVVQQGRGDRLKDSPEIFSGIVWTGQSSIELGLTEGFGSAEYVAREIIKTEEIVEFTVREGFADMFTKRLSEVALRIFAGDSWNMR